MQSSDTRGQHVNRALRAALSIAIPILIVPTTATAAKGPCTAVCRESGKLCPVRPTYKFRLTKDQCAETAAQPRKCRRQARRVLRNARATCKRLAGTCRRGCAGKPGPVAGGSLDGGFGTGGIVTTAVGSGDVLATDLAVQPDGRLVVAGMTLVPGVPEEFASEAGRSLVVARYDSDGALDPTFGDGGLAITTLTGTGLGHDPRTVALQSDGKILVAGDLAGELFIARYDTNGDFDPTFGGSGIVRSTGHGPAVDLALAPGGRIVIAGEQYIARYDETGTLDEGFGTGGTVEQPEIVNLAGLRVAADGTAIVGGTASLWYTAARFTADGAIDTAFGSASPFLGFVPEVPEGYAKANPVSLYGEHAVAFGVAQDGYGVIAAIESLGRGSARWLFFGIDSAGSPTYGVEELGSDSGTAQTTLAFQEDGAILTARCGFRNLSRLFSLARFDAAGSPDSSFGVDGFVYTPLGEVACARAVAPTPEAKIVAVGSAIIDGRRRFALARYHQ